MAPVQAGCDIDYGEFGIVDPTGELGGFVVARIVGACAQAPGACLLEMPQ